MEAFRNMTFAAETLPLVGPNDIVARCGDLLLSEDLGYLLIVGTKGRDRWIWSVSPLTEAGHA
jgi:hypothetical protein